MIGIAHELEVRCTSHLNNQGEEVTEKGLNLWGVACFKYEVKRKALQLNQER